MKHLRIFLAACLLALTFVACTNDDTIAPTQNVQESESVQNALSQLRTHFDDNGVLTADANPTGNLVIDFCFEFVYPITLIYNNGATVTVENLGELITVILNSTPELYIVGIEFPFDVIWYNPATNGTEIVTINNEDEFLALLESCIFEPCVCTDEYDPVCVEIETDQGPLVLTFPNACHAECEGFTEEDFVECQNDCECTDVYDPVCVKTDGAIIEFGNECLALCEGFTPNDFVDCPTDCECPAEIDPVCVETPSGNIIEFDNECLALCEGYTPNDFVDCPADGCDITNVAVEVGDCDPAGNVYVVTINFEVINATNDTFDVYGLNGEFIGNFPLSSLPLTLEFESNGTDFGGVLVCVNDNPDCCAEITWVPPTCGGGGECSITNLVADIGDCNPTGGYTVTIDFEYENPGNDFFDLFTLDGQFIGFFELASLPITVTFPPTGDFGGALVCINDTPDCCAEIDWVAPTCDDPCQCNDLYDPVCVGIGGAVVTYYNACYAECDGFTEADYVDCDPVEPCADCITEPYEPICVEFAGTVLTMYNECFLFCNGFTPNDIVDCN
ncbi:hypothetical protein POV27_12050 [Aureisphaera galaxeae]|uniref:hypothetical protein n=1 Tax=Aureisphaera galaxeae TaxID=1538023 RepID=UPI0023501E43|nr:hypothetical protein [Aureisphaera galaxeae]MDC8004787.1 hypothetical protein [Aureisphaera galaxeae]